MLNQRLWLAVSSGILVLLMAGGALRVRYAVAARHYATAQRVQGRDQVRHLEQTIDLNPGLIPARMQLARDLLALGEYNRALTQINQLIHMGRNGRLDLWELRQHQAEALYNLKRFPEAEEALRTALLLRPASAPSHLLLAQTVQSLGHSAAAQSEYRAAIQAAPSDGRAYLGLGALLLSTGQRNVAAQLKQKMPSSGPRLAMDWHRILAADHLRAGRLDAALGETSLAAGANPGSTWPHLAAAGILIRAGRSSEAVKESQRAVAIAPDDPAARLALAGSLESDQQWDRAVRVYQSLEKEQPAAFAHWVVTARGPRSDNPAAVLWQEHLELVINPGDVHLMGPDSEPGIQQVWYAGDEGEHHVNPRTANALFIQGALAQVRHDYTGAGQFYQNALHFIPTAESTHNTPFTNGLREAIEECIDSLIEARLSGAPRTE